MHKYRKVSKSYSFTMFTCRKSIVFLSSFLLFFRASFALYEDQVGKFDWKQSYVGKVRYSYVDLDLKQFRVFVATDSNVVAAFGLKGDGKILWRRLLEKGEYGDIKQLFVGSEVVSVSGNGPFMVRGWNKTTGLQTFEWSTPHSLTYSKSEKWTVDHSKVYQLAFASQTLEVTAFHLKNGNPAGSTKTISAQWLSSGNKCAVSNGVVSCVNSQNVLTFFNLGDSSMRSAQLDFNVENVEPLENGCLLRLDKNRQKAAVVSHQGKLTTVDVPLGASVSIGKKGNNHYIITTALASGKYETRTINVESNGEYKATASYTYPFSLPDYTSSSCTIVSNNNELVCYTFISSVDHSAILLRKGKLFWVREEALANVINVEMIDLPVSEEEAAIEKEFANKGGGILGMVTRRLSSQVLQAKNLFVTVLGLKDSTIEPGVRKDLVRDSFGFHKLILVVTSAMKIFGIDNENGEVIWQFYLKDFTPLNQLESQTVPLFLQRTSRHLPNPTMMTLLLKRKDTGASALFIFNPITGQSLEGFINLKQPVAQCLLLPETNEEFVHGILILYESGDVDIYPESTKDVAVEHAKSMFVYTIDSKNNAMSGRTFIKNSQDASLKSYPVWSIQLTDKVIAVTGKRRGEKVHSQGRVLGDRSVLYKYINPNLVAVATQASDPVHKSIISVYLVDTVSGAIVFSVVHKRAMEPVHIVHSENWVVYTFFNEKSRRTEIVMLDLYEGKTQRNTTAFSSLDPPLEPLVGRQAYIFPHHITTMKETITEKGITSKHILVGLGSGGVMEVPWSFLDSRRGVTPTAEMREEGVLPYIPELALPPEALITYNHTLIKIEGIHTSPAGLESTSLVFIYGLDLFYTRVSPSKTFDVLKDDFEYWLITAVLTGLITAAYVTKRLASRKALKQAWK
ncbi:ER membrane protein complex subunit 1 [Cimex lectularius]|uniref:ER membrane protein complex subunit 1 n=1 Tax=Cimex lectularius TaxID=79782 RepID=A0A8I6SD45_CIMLE|nr:ER membrane protein complex subunit 1 [Cimex lectularius]